MLCSLIALAALTPVTYTFPVGVKQVYDVTVVYDGVIPVFNDEPKKVEVDLGVQVVGVAGKGISVSSELVSLKLLLSGEAMPFGVNDVKEYIPKTTIQMTPEGKILASDAPDKVLPVQLPGLDIKRVPDFTYLPIEFPAGGVEVGKSWDFRKKFGQSDVTYTITPTLVSGEKVEMDVKVAQAYETLEDEAMQVVDKEADAIRRVATKVAGSGKAVFDLKKGLIASYRVEAQADSDVTDLKTKAKSTRKLKTLLTIRLR